MKKKTLIGLAIGTTLIVAAVWLNLKPQITEKLASPQSSKLESSELDSLLSYTDQSLNDVEAAIKNFDEIDENLDNEKTLAMTIDLLIKEDDLEYEPTPPLSDANSPDAKTTPPDDAAPDPKTVNINTSDLDALLGEIDAADSAADHSFSDLDSIDENEDKVNI